MLNNLNNPYNSKSAEYQFYFDDYLSFTSRNTDTYLSSYDKKIVLSKNTHLLYYPSTHSSKNAKPFLLIPSIFNSPEIFFLNKKKSFMSSLRDMGDVYLVDWQEIKDTNHRLDDYVREACKALSFIDNRAHVIGHCIGGNIALAASIMQPKHVDSLTLLTTPWDFSHFAGIFEANKWLNLDKNVRCLPQIPKLYIQILFFLLSPNYFNLKLDKYFKLINDEDKEFFLRVENWLMSGNCLPNQTYFQLIEDIEHNTQLNTKWIIDGITIDPKTFNKKVIMVVAKDDQLVPESSSIALYKSFDRAQLMVVPGGHIGYLISDQVETVILALKRSS